MTKDTNDSVSHSVTDKSRSTWQLKLFSPMSYAVFRESELGKPAHRSWTPAGRIGVLIVATRQRWSESAEFWLVADCREHEFMLNDGDIRRVRVIDKFLARVRNAVNESSMDIGSTWVMELVMAGDVPELGPLVRKE